MKSVRSEWFRFCGASFLVKALNPGQILGLDDQVHKGRISRDQALQELFKASLIGFKGIQGEKKISREKKVRALFQDPEIRNFVLWMGYNMLTTEANQMEKLRNSVERLLLVAGKLKS